MAPVVAAIHFHDALRLLERERRFARHVMVPGEVHAEQKVHWIQREREPALGQGFRERSRRGQAVRVPVVRRRIVWIEPQSMAEALFAGAQV